MGLKLYLAAALFNGRETLFNQLLTKQLEDLRYRVILPQRDGFEFGRLGQALANKMSPTDIENALQIMIYLLDVGWFVHQCDVVIANLDEPVDEGVVVEMAYAKLFRKTIVSFRTDVRSPYGKASERFGGGHFFPPMQADLHVTCLMPAQSPDDEMAELADQLHFAIQRGWKGTEVKLSGDGPQAQFANSLTSRAQYLFADVDDIHSDVGLQTIAERYLAKSGWLEEISPQLVH